MYAERHAIAVLTAADGSATAYSPVVSGRVAAIRYVKGDFENGVDFNITAEATGETIWAEQDVNASKSVHPFAAATDPAGAAMLFADGGEAVPAPIILAKDRVKIAIASGGATKTGTFHLIMA